MADINVSVTVPAVITATATDPNNVTVAVTTPAPVSVTASIGNAGDMTKAVYDTDNDGVVDNSEALGGVAAASYALSANVPANVTPSVVDNFVSFSNVTGAQKDSGKGLASLVYTLQCGTGANFTAADSTTYFFGGSLTTNTGTTRCGIYIPLAGTIVSVDVVVFVGAVLATTETSTIYLRLNDTTDTTISSSVLASAQLQRYQANTNISVVAGDFIEWKWVTPAWATNPTNVRVYGVAMVRV